MKKFDCTFSESDSDEIDFSSNGSEFTAKSFSIRRIIVLASSILPLEIKKRTDSGKYERITKKYKAGIAAITKAVCQPNFGITKEEINTATSQPTPQKLSSKTMNRPRKLVGAYSVTKDAATGNSPPKPIPTKNLNTNSDS